MNKFYFGIPLVLLVAFAFVYRGAVEEMDRKEATIKAQQAQEKAAQEAHRKEMEAIAQKDALKRQQEREAEEHAKAEKREREYQDAMRKLKDEADGYSKEADKYAKEAAELEIKLGEARILKDKTTREVFDLQKQVELAKIQRRNAELEIQRMVEMVGQKATAMAAMPPPPPAPK
jgi:preprotein translocase subunit SecF